jgi:hypothetical protein
MNRQFIAKVGAIGANPKSLFVVIPKDVCRFCNIQKGNIVQLAFIEKRTLQSYPFVNGAVEKAQQGEHIRTKIFEAKQFGFSDDVLEYATKEAYYLISVLSTHARSVTRVSTVVATALYVASMNLGSHKTQKQIAEIYHITEVTLRNNLKKGWKWNIDTCTPLERKAHELLQVVS